jgi:hypothetical protein
VRWEGFQQRITKLFKTAACQSHKPTPPCGHILPQYHVHPTASVQEVRILVKVLFISISADECHITAVSPHHTIDGRPLTNPSPVPIYRVDPRESATLFSALF